MKQCTAGIILTLGFGILSVSLVADAQQPPNVPRIGVLFPAGAPSPEEPHIAAFRQALQNLGYVDGQTVAMEYRYALGKVERIPDLVAELVRLKVDILVVGSGAAARAAKHATQTIPIVFVGGSDPVGSGLVTGLARPGGNLTGLSFAFSEGFGGKWVELLAEAVPEMSRMAVLRHAGSPPHPTYDKDIPAAAQALGLTLQSIQVNDLAELDGAFARMTKDRADALIVDASVFLAAHHSRVVELAAKHRLPAMYSLRHYVDAGGFMSYGVSIADLWRRAATYVDKILKGAKPADLPVEQPMKFELVINLKTAQAQGLTIPPSAVPSRRDDPMTWRRNQEAAMAHSITSFSAIVTLALVILMVPLTVAAQQTRTVPRIGYLENQSAADADASRFLEAFRQGLRELGYVKGQSIALEYRVAEGKLERLPDLAAELVRLKVDVIVTWGPGIRAAKRATTTLPIVMAST
ncbi:MAG: ABC transporter substrate binding protein, partial [Candidatus Entotheonellia bacterium]